MEMEERNPEPCIGMSNRDAIQKLCQCIITEIKSEEERIQKCAMQDLVSLVRRRNFPGRDSLMWILLGLRHTARRKSFALSFCWRLSVLSLVIVLVLCAGSFSSRLSSIDIYPGLTLLLILAFNILLSIKQEKWRRSELVRRAWAVVEKFETVLDDSVSKGEPEEKSNLGENMKINLECFNLFSPSSECMTLQWTYRDGILLNIPWILLVEGDAILLRPGKEVPCRCVTSDKKEYSAGEVYMVPEKELESVDGVVKPFPPLHCQLLDTPVVAFLQTCFQSPERPIGVLDNEMYRGFHLFVECYLLPIGILAALLVSMFRIVLHSDSGGNLTEMLTTIPACMILPLLGLMTPLLHYILNMWSQATVLSLTDPTGGSVTADYARMFSYNSEDTEKGSEAEKSLSSRFTSIFWNFQCLLRGSPTYLPFTSNIVETLGTVTSVSVVDKKGILSWPNPTPEKIFFLRNSDPSANLPGPPTFTSRRDSTAGSVVAPEVMNLTHNPFHAFAVSFDDPSWEKHLPNLKPMGMSMLLNSCQLDDRYLTFEDHIHVVSRYVPRTIAVANRRCCCYLAASMGFSPETLATQFKVEETVAAYKKQPGEAPLPGLTKHRTPMPNVFGALVSEKNISHRHVMNQGTADLLLEFSSHCWTGENIVELSRSLRRKIADFYHRNSMTSYCLAYSYSPHIQERTMPLGYMDWPLDPQLVDGLEPKSCPDLIKASRSLENLSMSLESVNVLPPDNPLQSTFRKQVFLGMITLQYQAKADVVEMVEHLDKACIRFVHFSKENELRSRVFAEKMGLESGWNCHISLAKEGSVNAMPSEKSKVALKNKETCASFASIGLTERPPLGRHQRKRSLSKNFTFLPPNQRRRRKRADDSCMDSEGQNTSDVPLAETESVENLSEINEKEDRKEDVPLLASETGSQTSGDGSIVHDQGKEEYFMFNRAQLPKGVENVRPHLENVDNVPLLVGLFTDCDHDSTREMIQVMQDYAEVVLILGSSLNYYNADIFCQANASIAIEPMQPMNCVHRFPSPSSNLTAATLSSWIYTLPCGIFSRCGDKVNVLSLLGQSRHCLSSMRAALVFYCFASFFLSVHQLLCLLLFLPPPFSLSQLLFFLAFILPMLSLSFCGAPADMDSVLQKATSKNDNWLPKKTIMKSFVLGFIAKFVPAILMGVAVYGFTLGSLCRTVDNSDCFWYLNRNRTLEYAQQGTWAGWGAEYVDLLEIARSVLAVTVTVYLCVISASFNYCSLSMWSRSPARNVLWLCVCIFVNIVQILYRRVESRLLFQMFEHVPWYIFASAATWIVPIIVFGELYKHREIAAYRREQRRRRLSFGTKLGLNSPF